MKSSAWLPSGWYAERSLLDLSSWTYGVSKDEVADTLAKNGAVIPFTAEPVLTNGTMRTSQGMNYGKKLV